MTLGVGKAASILALADDVVVRHSYFMSEDRTNRTNRSIDFEHMAWLEICCAARAMSRESPRFIPADSLVEITARTVGGRFLLVPSKELNAAILAIIGRALALSRVELHAVSFMSNHWHALVSVPDAEELSRFVQHVHSNVARFVQRLRGWDGKVFRKAAYIVVGAASEEARLRYVLSQGVKEGLVRRCVDWPGVHSARALLLDEVLVGRWRGRRAERTLRAGGGRGGGREPLPGEVETIYPIDFAPLPSWRHLDQGERVRRLETIVNEIEASARVKHPTVLGVRGVLACDPSSKPNELGRSPAPRIHTADPDERSAFTSHHIDFSTLFFNARSRLRMGRLATLPVGCFAPITPFSRSSTVLQALRSVASTEPISRAAPPAPS